MNKVLFTRWKSNIGAFHFMKDRLVEVSFFKEQSKEAAIGDIYVGRVAKIIPGIHACFINYSKEDTAFVTLKDLCQPVLINRSYDGEIKCGDEVLIQITTEAGKGKQPGATGRLSLSGNYCVVSNDPGRVACSGKMSSEQKSFWKKAITDAFIKNDYTSQYSVIIRTNATELPSAEPILKECMKLEATLSQVIQDGEHRTCFSKIYSAANGYISYIKNMRREEFDEVVTDQADILQELQAFMEEDASFEESGKTLRFYEDAKISLAKLYGLETKLEDALSKKVWLSCGGFLYIEPTEALTVIDVNSGKFEKKNKPEEYHFAVNKEAAMEIALQLRLRNLSGIIVVDFINMKEKEQVQELTNLLSKALKKDKVPAQVADVTKLGLVEITRKKTEKPLYEQVRGLE